MTVSDLMKILPGNVELVIKLVSEDQVIKIKEDDINWCVSEGKAYIEIL